MEQPPGQPTNRHFERVDARSGTAATRPVRRVTGIVSPLHLPTAQHGPATQVVLRQTSQCFSPRTGSVDGVAGTRRRAQFESAAARAAFARARLLSALEERCAAVDAATTPDDSRRVQHAECRPTWPGEPSQAARATNQNDTRMGIPQRRSLLLQRVDSVESGPAGRH